MKWAKKGKLIDKQKKKEWLRVIGIEIYKAVDQTTSVRFLDR